jgi:5-hydroxyisourate hydrolase
MAEGPTISTHVLDTERGLPGVGYMVTLYRSERDSVTQVGSGTTDDDGRIQRLLDGSLLAGEYRIEVEIGGAFFRHAAISFVIEDVERSYHVPLLLSSYSLTTYRGS